MDFSQLPSVDRILNHADGQALTDLFGHAAVVAATRAHIDSLRQSLIAGTEAATDDDSVVNAIGMLLNAQNTLGLKPVINLTGTVLHTNLGRASLPVSAIEAVKRVAEGNSNLEFDLTTGKRGDRDDHIEGILREITGAQAATVVNNNAAAVMLALNTLAAGRSVPVSRGELVEIGGSFRIPEIMERSGCRLVEVGATNRTHLKDYSAVIDDQTAMLMKVHTSNYEIQGFTASVSEQELGALAKANNLPMMTDLGSGTLIRLEQFGLPHEPTAQEAIANGASVVTFSGDKLLGGPQAGIIVGEKDLIARIKSNPMKRALRVDKMTLAALHAVLELYRHPERLVVEVPTLRHLSRTVAEIEPLAIAAAACFSANLQGFRIEVIPTESQIGSGALPLNKIPSQGVRLTPESGSDRELSALATHLRELTVPILGRIHDGAMILDCRTLDNIETLADSLIQSGSL